MLIRLRNQTVQAALALIAFLLVMFIASRLSGDPARLLLPADAPQEQVSVLRQQLGLDGSYLQQVEIFVKNAVTLDFGRSVESQEPVRQILARRTGATLELAGVALLLVLIVAVPLAVLAATRRNRVADYLTRALAAAGQTIPPFWLGIVLIELLAVHVRLLPASGKSDWRSFLLPALVEGLFMGAALIRLLRTSMLHNLDAEFVKLARSKGLGWRRIVWRHVLRNGALPVLTLGSLLVSLFLAGAVVTETVFEWPGLGQVTYQAIARHDYPVIQGVVVLACFAVVAISLLLDGLHAIADPRVRA